MRTSGNAGCAHSSGNGFAKILVSVDIRRSLRRSSQSELHSRFEVRQNCAPRAFVIRATAVALVNYNEVKEVWRVFAEIWRRINERLPWPDRPSLPERKPTMGRRRRAAPRKQK